MYTPTKWNPYVFKTRWLAKAALCTGILVAELSAQQPKPESESRDVVTLPVFSVASSPEDGYTASESTSGTRMATKLINLPYSVQVLPQEFFRDFLLFDIDQMTPFIAGVAPGDPNTGGGGSARMRGFTAPYFRDGFIRRQLPESNSIDRVEVVRGPQSAIYGRVSPGGVVNFIAKKPRTVPSERVTTTFGDYDYRRAEIDLTGPLIPGKLFYRAGGGYTHSTNPVDYYYNSTTSGNFSLIYKISDDTSVTVEFEKIKKNINESDLATNGLLRWTNPAGIVQGSIYNMPGELGKELLTYNMGSASRRALRLSDSGYFRFEHRFSPDLNLRANFGVSTFDFNRYGAASTATWDVRVANYASTFANVDWLDETQGMWSADRSMTRTTIKQRQFGPQFDLSKNWTGKIKQRSLITVDAFVDNIKQRGWSLTGANLNKALAEIGVVTLQQQTAWKRPDPFNREVTENYALPAFADWWPLTDGSTFNLYNTYYGGLINHTVELFDSRMILTASGRHDWVEYHRQQPLSTRTTTKDATSKLTKDTFSIGGNYHFIRDKVVGYISYGTGFNPSPQVDQNTGDIYGNKTSKGVDYGIKGALLDGILSYSLSAYRVEESNQATNNPNNVGGADPTLPALVPGGSAMCVGQDISIAGRLTENLTLLANASWTDLWITKNLASPALVGTPPLGGQNGPKRTGSLAFRYTVTTGPLKGLRYGVSYLHSTSFLRVAAGATNVAINVQSQDQVSGFLGYTWKLEKKKTLSVNLNLTNLTDQHHTTAAYFPPQGTGYRITTSLGF